MSTLFSGFEESRDAAGRSCIDFSARVGPMLLAVVAVPLIGAAAARLALGGGPMGLPWFVPFAALGVSCVGAAVLLLFFLPRSRVRIVIDKAAGSLAIESMGERKQLPLKDVKQARIATTKTVSESSDGESEQTVLVYRLELLLASGEWVPATQASFSHYHGSDRAKVVNAINRELGVAAPDSR